MKNILVIVALLGALLFQFVGQASARSGCCSYHGGVCGCGCCDGSSLSSTCAPYYPECSGGGSSVQTNTFQPVNTAADVVPTTRPILKPTSRPLIIPTKRPTLQPTTRAVACSAQSDNICSKTCTAGNDADCCLKTEGYTWYKNWGCYPEKLSCSAQTDGVCDWYCTAGNDADCCSQRLKGYTWYANRGCYPRK